VFQAFRSPQGEDMVLEKNIFVERVLPGSVLRDMSEAEMAAYRQPFAEPAEVAKIVSDYAAWMAENEFPKLFINAEPGEILTGAQRDFCRSWKNQQDVTVKGSHFIQEDSPSEIAEAIASWISRL
jgi:haloalkane dehalogenase